MADGGLTLKKFEFPYVPQVAVKQLESCVRGGDGAAPAIPGLGPSREELLEKLVEEHVFYRKAGRQGQARKLTPNQDMRLLDALNEFFDVTPEDDVRHSMFGTLFSRVSGDAERTGILARLVSMAIAVNNKRLLDCAAVWMQRQGCGSDEVTHIASAVLRDYCTLASDAPARLRSLPDLSPHFACNFITAVSAVYTPCGFGGKMKKTLQSEVVEIVADWLAKDAHLSLVSVDQSQSAYIQPQRSSLWTSPTKPNTQTPVPGLVRWCTQAPIAHALAQAKNQSQSQNDSKSFSSELTQQQHKTEQLWSQLHLSLIQTIMDFPNLTGANQLELVTLADMNRIVKDLVALIREAKNKGLAEDPYGAQCIETSVDRTVQVLQVSLGTGAFRCSLADLQAIFKLLPQNRLLQILQNQHLSRAPPPMHHERK